MQRWFGALLAATLACAIAWADGLTVPFLMPATTCSNQFVRSIATITGVGTCAAIAAGDFPALTGDVTTPGGSLATTLVASARLKSATVSSTRDLTVASGSVAYTGFGFQPTSCFVSAGVSAGLSYTTIIGYADSARVAATTVSVSNANISVTGGVFVSLVDVTGANSQTATIASYDADGLTLSWTKTASPTGTANLRFMCFR